MGGCIWIGRSVVVGRYGLSDPDAASRSRALSSTAQVGLIVLPRTQVLAAGFHSKRSPYRRRHEALYPCEPIVVKRCESRAPGKSVKRSGIRRPHRDAMCPRQSYATNSSKQQSDMLVPMSGRETRRGVRERGRAVGGQRYRIARDASVDSLGVLPRPFVLFGNL